MRGKSRYEISYKVLKLKVYKVRKVIKLRGRRGDGGFSLCENPPSAYPVIKLLFILRGHPGAGRDPSLKLGRTSLVIGLPAFGGEVISGFKSLNTGFPFSWE